MGNYHARFGSGGGVGDRPADHNAADLAILHDFNVSTRISVSWLAKILTPHPPSGLCGCRWAALSPGDTAVQREWSSKVSERVRGNRMQALKRIWQDIRHGENVDLYVTVGASIVLTVLSLVGWTNPSVIASLTLGVLGLLAIASLVNRRKMEQVLEKIRDEINAFGGRSSVCFLSDKQRRFMTSEYVKMAANAEQIDVVALSMSALLENASDLAQWILNEGKTIRILVLAPSASAARIRGREEGIDLPSKIINQVEELQALYEKIQTELIEYNERCKGSLEVRFYDGIPYFAYFRADKEMIIGLYYSHLKGLESECLYIRTPEHPVYHKMLDHFDALWKGKAEIGVSPEERVICRITHSESRFIDMEKLHAAVS